MDSKPGAMKIAIRVIGGTFLILSGMGSLVLYVTFRGKADSWLTSIAIFSLFGMGVGLIAFGIWQIMMILKKTQDRQKKG